MTLSSAFDASVGGGLIETTEKTIASEIPTKKAPKSKYARQADLQVKRETRKQYLKN